MGSLAFISLVFIYTGSSQQKYLVMKLPQYLITISIKRKIMILYQNLFEPTFFITYWLDEWPHICTPKLDF